MEEAIAASPVPKPRLTVIVAARQAPATLEQTLNSLAQQTCRDRLEVIVADGSAAGEMASTARRCFPRAEHVWLRGGNLPALKGAAIQRARGAFIAILDPHDAADPDWGDQILAGFADPSVAALGGVVLLDGPERAGNLAAYLFEYGAFNPPVRAGDTAGDLPGNNVAYRREALLDTCADVLATEGFNKPFCHERLRGSGKRLVIRPTMRVRHLTSYALLSFGVRRFHYGRCFGAVRTRRASAAQKTLYRVFAPAVPPLLVFRQLKRASAHPQNRRLLPRAGLALCGVCVCWGVGEWLGSWFGAGRSCGELY